MLLRRLEYDSLLATDISSYPAVLLPAVTENLMSFIMHLHMSEAVA